MMGTPGPRRATASGLDAYLAKDPTYFTGERQDYVAELPANPKARILEIGCSGGRTGQLALTTGRCESYIGVEICREVAEQARGRITEVLVGNVEELELPWDAESFDVLVLSEVLEHLVDPWKVLRKLHPLLKRGGLIFASSPNISHYRTIYMLARGDWALTDMGPMDRTHLRWFTPKTYRELFEACGYEVCSAKELAPLSWKAKAVLMLGLGRARHLFVVQIDLRARKKI